MYSVLVRFVNASRIFLIKRNTHLLSLNKHNQTTCVPVVAFYCRKQYMSSIISPVLEATENTRACTCVISVYMQCMLHANIT